MNVNITKLFRSTSREYLSTYFKSYLPTISRIISWDEFHKNVIKSLLKAINDLDDDELAQLNHHAERINEMTDEIGQTALLSIIADQDFNEYQSLQSAHDRALYVFLQDQNSFNRAEEIRYTDHYRKSRLWDGFEGPKNEKVSQDALDIKKFQQKIREYFRTDKKIKIEIFDRNKIYSDDQKLNLVQVVIYREGLPESYKALEDDDLISKTFRPIIEIALTYEPLSGQIEVIAENKECRIEVAKAFTAALLGIEAKAEKVSLKQYNLSKFLCPFDFPTDPEDGIDTVKITMLKLKPYGDNNKVTLEISAKEKRTIYEISQKWFNTHSPLHGEFYVSQVKLVISFMPDEKHPRGKVVSVKISWPNSCDLKDKTDKERLIGHKYLKRWSLIKEI